MNDTTIYKHAAIETVRDVCKRSPTIAIRAMDALRKLPAAQPERLTDDDFETIRIHLSAYKEKLCNQHRWEEAEEYQRIINRFMAFASTQPEIEERKKDSAQIVPNGELISKEAAIDAMTNTLWHYPNECYRNLNEYEFAKGLAELGLKSVPPAQPERKKGKWMYDGDCYICDQCKSAFCWWADSQTSNYCPNCGADMRGEQND